MIVFISLLPSFPLENSLLKTIWTDYPISIRELDERDILYSKTRIPKTLIFSLCMSYA